jgi:two-component system, NarL family, nitrate/nitrite response regulator NarL
MSLSLRVVVVAEVRLYREGLRDGLSSRDGLAVVGTAGSLEEVRRVVAVTRPDVVVLDMATRDSLRIVTALREEEPAPKIVAFALDDTDRDIFACAEAGVAGYVPCEGSTDDLVATIVSCARGELICSPRIAALLFGRLRSLAAGGRGPAATFKLTGRELQIARLIDAGLSNKEIAQDLGIEVATVKNHVHNLLEKLRVTSRAEAAARLRGYLPRSERVPAPMRA